MKEHTKFNAVTMAATDVGAMNVVAVTVISWYGAYVDCVHTLFLVLIVVDQK
jgi:hypothetical protein